MIKILKEEKKDKFYRIWHTGCCEFIATKNEFKWSNSPKNETYVDMICPVCGKQFYGDYEPCDENGEIISKPTPHYGFPFMI